MRTRISLLLIPLLLIASSSALLAQGGDPNYEPRRINKMIELLEDGQPIYDLSVRAAGYEDGLALAQTHNDLIQYQMEHAPFDIILLREFMQGLVDGGPTPSGHRTPTVIVTLPVVGIDAISIRTNFWMIEQILGSGVHGLMLCHARNPEAVKEFVAMSRYQFARPGLNDGMIPEGMRGAGGQGFAAQIWGVSNLEYTDLADPWPMNPNGELILSLKLEDKYALENVEQITPIPGIAWGEWGPGDQALSIMGYEYYVKGEGRVPAPPRTSTAPQLPWTGHPTLEAARTRIFDSMKANGQFILHSSNLGNLTELLDWGVMVTHGTSVEVTNLGRAHTNRQMPY